jgi:DNA-binding NarL/FixJ family response regulator
MFVDGDDRCPEVVSPRVEGRSHQETIMQQLTHSVLTPKEREIAALVAEDLSNAQIARRLVITSGTVANHLGHILRALGTRSRVSVAVWSVEQQVYRPPADPGCS